MYPLLLTLALVLPFELTQPLFFVGPVGITSVELPLYALLALSLTRRDVWRPSSWTPVHWAAIVWAAAHLASAAAAEGDRSLPLRFALRMCAGAALVFPVGASTPPTGRAEGVLLALVAGGVFSAALGLLETLAPGGAGLLSPFKTVTARVGEALRAGGPFQYPNPAALFWGATLPALLVVGAPTSPGAGRHRRLITAACALVLLAAAAATGSRGGLVAAAVALAVLAAAGGSNLRRPALLAFGGLAAAVLIAGRANPTLMMRGPAFGDPPWFAGRFEAVGSPPEITAGQRARLRTRVRNVGALGWETAGPMPMGVAVQWREATGGLAHEEPPTPLARAVAPGGTALVDAEVTAPARPGLYRLRWQLVGGNTAFENPDTPSEEIPITVVGPPVSAGPTTLLPRRVQRQATRPELWRAGGRMWRERPLLGVGPDNFRRLYGPYLGPRTLDDRVNANSLYVETLANLGLVGAASLVLLFAALAHGAFREWRNERGPERMMVIASGAALLAIALHGIVDSVLPATPLYGLFWIHAGLLAGLSREGGRGGHPTRRFWAG